MSLEVGRPNHLTVRLGFWSALLGGVGYALEITPLVFFTINFGMGGAVMALTVAVCFWFGRMEKQITHEHSVTALPEN